MCENMQVKLRKLVEGVIGTHRTIYQCTAFADALGKVVTVRYQGAPGGDREKQSEAVHILLALRGSDFAAYKVRLFVTNRDGKNVGSIELVSLKILVIEFKRAGNKWVGALADAPDFRPVQGAFIEYIDETTEFGPKEWGKLTKNIRRISDTFRKFYGVPKWDDAVEMTSPPDPLSASSEGEVEDDEDDEDDEDSA